MSLSDRKANKKRHNRKQFYIDDFTNSVLEMKMKELGHKNYSNFFTILICNDSPYGLIIKDLIRKLNPDSSNLNQALTHANEFRKGSIDGTITVTIANKILHAIEENTKTKNNLLEEVRKLR